MPDLDFTDSDSGSDGTGDVGAEAAAARSVIDLDDAPTTDQESPDFDGYVAGEGGVDAVPDRAPRAPRQDPQAVEAARAAATEANARFRERQERRNFQREQANLELTAARERAEKATRLSNTLLQMLQRQKAAAAQEDDGTDPDLRAALDRNREQLRQEIGEELRPLREETERQRAEREAQEQAAQQHQQSEAAWSEFRGEVVAAEQDYRATPQGQGYDQRVHQYKGRIAGIAQELSAYVPELANPQVVEALILEDMKGIAGMAHAFRVSPAVMMDIVARQFLGLQQARGNGNGSRRQGAVSREVQVAREATLAGATHRGTRSAPQRGRRGFVSAEEILERDLSSEELEQMATSGRFADLIGRLAQDAEEIAEEL